MLKTFISIVDTLKSVPFGLLEVLPSVLFLLIVGIAVIVGMIRGFRKSLILLINIIIAAGLTFGSFYYFMSQKDFDERIITMVNQTMGHGYLNNMLKVDPNLTGIGEIAIAYATNLVDGGNEFTQIGIQVLGSADAYITCIAEMVIRFAMLFVLLVIYYVLVFILYIFYLIFFKEGRRKRKHNNQFNEGQRSVGYKKGALMGGVVGGVKGLVKAFVIFSFFGSFMFIISGGNYNDADIQNETDTETSEEMQVITSFYNFFKSYGSTGIGKILEDFKDKNNVPYYLMIADFFSKGYLEDESLEISEYVYAREELAVITSIANRALEYAIKNNIPLDFDDYLGMVQTLLKDPGFEEVLVEVIEDIANEKIFINLAKSCLDSAIIAYTEETDNELIKIAFGVEEPLSITKEVITKDNFKTLLSMIIKTVNTLDDMGYSLNNLDKLNFEDLLLQMEEYKAEIVDIYSTLMDLTLFTSPTISLKVDVILKDIFTFYLDKTVETNELFSKIDTGYIADINFVDKFDDEGNKIADGELSTILSLLGDIIDSGIATVDFSNIDEIIKTLTTKDSNKKLLVEKLLDSNFVYYTLSSVLKADLLGEQMTIYVPADCEIEINGRNFVRKTELVTTFNVLSNLLSEVTLEELQSDDVVNKILSLDEDVLLGLLDSCIIQGTLAVTLNSDLLAEITIPDHLQFYVIENGEYAVDDNGKKIITSSKMKLWIDELDENGQIVFIGEGENKTVKTPGEIRNMISGALGLNISSLISGGMDNIDPTVFFDLSKEQILDAFNSEILRYSVTSFAENNLSNDDFTIVIPYCATSENDGKAITGEEFYSLLQAVKIITNYDPDSEEPFDINNLEFDIKTITENKETILESTILHASIIQMLYDMSLEEDAQIFIPDEFTADLQIPLARSADPKPKLVTDFKNTVWYQKEEISNLFDAIETLGIEDLEKMDEAVDNIGNVLKDENKINIILYSYVLELTLIDNVYDILNETDGVFIPSELKIYDENGNKSTTNLNNWLSERNDRTINPEGQEIVTFKTHGELMRLVTALRRLDLTDAFGSGTSDSEGETEDDGETSGFDFSPEKLLKAEEADMRVALESLIIIYSFTEQICDLAATVNDDGSDKEATLTVPDIAFAEGKKFTDEEKYIHPDEIIRMIRAINVILPEDGKIEELEINVGDIIGKDKEEDHDILIASIVVHATLIAQISQYTTGDGALAGQISIPELYNDPINADNGTDLKGNFNDNVWVINGEIKKMLTAIGALGLKFNENNELVKTDENGEPIKDENGNEVTGFDYKLVNKLNEKYYGETDEREVTNLQVICASVILHFTLGEKITEASDQLVVPVEVYFNKIEGQTEKFVFVSELADLINSFNALDIDIEKADEIEFKSVFEFKDEEEEDKYEGKIDNKLEYILKSRILEYTLTKLSFDNFTEDIVIINELSSTAVDPEDDEKTISVPNYENWVSLRTEDEYEYEVNGETFKEGKLDIGFDSQRELYRLLIAIQRLEIANALDSGDIDVKINSILGPENIEKRDKLIESKLLHATMINQIYTLTADDGGMSGVVYIPTNYKTAAEKENLVNNFDSNIWNGTEKEILKLLDGIDAFGLEFDDDNNIKSSKDDEDSDDENSSSEFDYALVKQLNDHYTDNKSRLDVICESVVLHFTLSTQIRDQENLFVVEDVEETEEGNVYIKIFELSNLINSIKIMDLDFEAENPIQIASLFNIDEVDDEGNKIYNTVDEKLNALLQSMIFEATIIDKIVELTSEEGGMSGTIHIPSNYLAEASKENLPVSFTTNIWHKEQEVLHLLKGIDAFGLEFDDDNNIIFKDEEGNTQEEFDFNIVKDLNSTYEVVDNTPNSKLNVICESVVLHFTLSTKIIEQEDLVVIKEVTRIDSQERYILLVELTNLIDAINIMGLDFGGTGDTLTLADIFEISGTNYTSVDDKIADILKSVIFEATIAKKAFESLNKNEDTVIIDELVIILSDFTEHNNYFSESANNIYNWLTVRNGEDEVHKEVYNLLVAVDRLGIANNIDSGDMNIQISTILTSENSEKREKLVQSNIIHASLISQINDLTETGMKGTIYIPFEYKKEASRDYLENPENIFSGNIWNGDEKEVLRLLDGIDAFGLKFNENNDVVHIDENNVEKEGFNFNIIKDLNSDFEKTSKTRLEIVCNSVVLYFTLSTQIVEQEDLVVITDVIESTMSTLDEKYITFNELTNLIEAIDIMDLDFGGEESALKLADIFNIDEVDEEGNQKYTKVDDKIADILKSVIFEATIAKKAFENLSGTSSTAVIISSLVLNSGDFDVHNNYFEDSANRDNNIYNWLTEVNDGTPIYKEVYYLLIAIDRLEFAEKIESGEMDVQLNTILSDENSNKRQELVQSNIIHASLIEQVNSLTTSGMSGTIFIPEMYATQADINYLTDSNNDFNNNIWNGTKKEILKLLDGIDAFGLVFNKDNDIGSVDEDGDFQEGFNFNLINGLNDSYSDDTRLGIVCKSIILHFTLSKQISDRDMLVIVHIVKEVFENYTSDEKIIIKDEIARMIDALNVLNLDVNNMDLTSGSTILGLEDTEIETLMQSLIVGYTLSDQIADIEELAKANLGYDLEAQAITGSVLIKTKEMQALIGALRIILGYDPDATDNSGIDTVSVSADDLFGYIEVVNTDTGETKLDIICKSYIMWLTLSGEIFAQGKTGIDDSSKSIFIPNDTDNAIMIDNESGTIQLYIVEQEIENLITALKALLGEEPSFSTISPQVPSPENISIILDSSIMHATLSDMVIENFRIPKDSVNVVEMYAQVLFNMSVIKVDDLEDLFVALNLFLGGKTFNNPTFSISGETSILDDLLKIFDPSNHDEYGEQTILLATISENVLANNYVPQLTPEQMTNPSLSEYGYQQAAVITSGYEKASIVESDMVYLTKDEMFKLIDAFSTLGIDFNGDGLSIPTVSNLLSDEEKQDTILASQVAWLLLSDLLYGDIYDTLTSETIPNPISSFPPTVYNPYYNEGISVAKDLTVSIYDKVGVEDYNKYIIHPDNLIAAFTGNIPVLS